MSSSKSLIGKKTIALYPFEKDRHSLYNNVLELLSQKFNVIYKPKGKRGKITPLFRIMKYYPLRYSYHRFIRKFLSVNDIKFMFKKEKPERLNYDLIYSVAKIPPFKNNYIIDFEKVSNLADHAHERLDKKYIAKKFAESNCKVIIPWSNIAKRSLIETIDCSKFEHKIKVIPFGIHSDKIKKDYNKKNVTLFFVSSTNNPFDFELKGGIIALETYSRLIKKYTNLRFVVRAHFPKWIKKKYGHLPGLKFIDKFIPRKELDKLFLDADILLEARPGMVAMLECMNYAIPAVAFDEILIPEMIIDKKNGLLVDSSLIYGKYKTKKDFQKYLENYHLNYFKNFGKEAINPKIIDEFVEKTSKLIEDKSLRIKMSKFAKSLVEPGGRYNLKARNEELLEVIEKSFE